MASGWGPGGAPGSAWGSRTETWHLIHGAPPWASIWLQNAFLLFLLHLSFLLESFFFSRLDHLFLYEIEKELVDEFLHLKIYNSTSNFTKVWFFMYCSFHLKLCIFTTYVSSKIIYIQGKCEVKYVKLWSLSKAHTIQHLSSNR